ncbi:MAG: NADPH:quinone reductase-like Zn-dependent oxidoreductase [Gammaproteobacteria bacterium]|jgi:NADPH:quinone reductase-like Zn-dependent oxidoreductase
MKALIYEQPGGPQVLQYRDEPDPKPGARDVVVRVAASTVNHLDAIQRNGWFTMPGFTLPHISGMDIAGTVIEIGEEVSMVKLGDRVLVDPSLSEVPEKSKLSGMGDLYGELGVLGANVAGGYAELCLAPETHLYSIPDTMSWHHAVMFPTAWMTAHHALFDVAELQGGETLLIHAAGSGVSMAGIQWAKQAGARVLATAGSEKKCERALELGADHACNNRATDVAAWARELTEGKGVNVVFDHVGEALWAASMFSMAPRGRLVNCGGTSGNSPVIPNLGYMYHMGLRIMGSDPYRYEEFAPAWAQYCESDFQAVVDSVFPLADGAQAQDKLLSGDFFGKIILEP